jgi:hypothetical protein
VRLPAPGIGALVDYPGAAAALHYHLAAVFRAASASARQLGPRVSKSGTRLHGLRDY